LSSGHHRTTLSDCILATKAFINNWKKIVKQQYLLHMSPQYGELQPTRSLDWFRSLWHSSKFQQVSHLAFVTRATSVTGSQPNFAQCLAVSWAGALHTHKHIFGGWGLLPPKGILPGAEFTLRPCLALYYIDSITARHSSSGHKPNFAGWYKEWMYWIFAEGATYMAGRPSRWASTHIFSWFCFRFHTAVRCAGSQHGIAITRHCACSQQLPVNLIHCIDLLKRGSKNFYFAWSCPLEYCNIMTAFFFYNYRAPCGLRGRK